MKTKKQHKIKTAFHKNLERITMEKINQMVVIDSEDQIRFLKDPKTGFYVVFNPLVNQIHYSSTFKDAQQFFNRLINSTK